ncbi:hypothetical protein BZJ17_13275 [Salinivibrio sp. IB574]|uniref:glycosyltransferase n=1 Tax=Salinivibrio sp. IB574 TaxID=1909444 RepID=UPI0009895006|nr:glycosyltransferase [Salinivibrio sp. IB574]OOF20419.1 hypothetical protein BZJ17_13275 [Salinivibrio sp. IB574]
MNKKLLLGNPNSIFIREMISELKKLNQNLQVDLILSKRHQVGKISADNVYNFIPDSEVSLYKLFAFYFSFYKWFFSSNSKYKSIDVHFVNIYYLPILPLLKLKCESLNLVFWGSDLLRCKYQKLLGVMIGMADVINISSENMKRELVSKFSNSLKGKQITINRFGSLSLDLVDKVNKADANNDNCYFYESLNKFDNKTIVTIGYNASRAQQHLKVIKTIKDKCHVDSYVFVFPFTYGVEDSSYINEIKAATEGLNVVFLEEYMTDFEIAYLRIKTDIFIQVQITDAFSMSMQEHMYAGNRVITGSWLKYDELSSERTVFEQVDSIDEIGGLLDRPLLSVDEKNHNRNIIHKLSNWTSVIDGWERLGRK